MITISLTISRMLMDIALFVLPLEIKVTQKCNQKSFSVKIPKVKLTITHKTPLAFLHFR